MNEWEEYLLSIGVTNLSDDGEIARKLEEIEQANPDYKAQVIQAIESIDEPFIAVDSTNIAAWLESLGN